MGKNLVEFRELIDFSQHEVSIHSGVSQTTISDIENGAIPRVNTALKLSKWADAEAILHRIPRKDWLDWSYVLE